MKYTYFIIQGKRYKTCNPNYEEHILYVFGTTCFKIVRNNGKEAIEF